MSIGAKVMSLTNPETRPIGLERAHKALQNEFAPETMSAVVARSQVLSVPVP